MKKVVISLLLAVVLPSISYSQKFERDRFKFSLIPSIVFDSMSVNKDTSKIKIVDKPIKTETLEAALSSFFSYDTYEWGHSLTTCDYYKKYPTKSMLEKRNSKDYKQNANYTVLSYTHYIYNGVPIVFVYCKSYISKQMPNYHQLLCFTQSEGGNWELYSDKFISKYSKLSKLKHEYYVALILDQNNIENKKFLALQKEVVSNGSLDLNAVGKELGSVLSKKEEPSEYSSIVNLSSIKTKKVLWVK